MHISRLAVSPHAIELQRTRRDPETAQWAWLLLLLSACSSGESAERDRTDASPAHSNDAGGQTQDGTRSTSEPAHDSGGPMLSAAEAGPNTTTGTEQSTGNTEQSAFSDSGGVVQRDAGMSEALDAGLGLGHHSDAGPDADPRPGVDAGPKPGLSALDSGAPNAAFDAGSGNTTGALSSEQVEQIHAVVQSQFEIPEGATGYSVAVWRDGEVIYAEGFGTRNEAGEPVTPDTQFQIGSDTKKLTAIALLQQVEAGQLELEQTVASLLPDLQLASQPGYFETLTVRDLLTHRSGLFDYTPWTDAPADAALAEWIYGRFADNAYTLMPAGIAHSYSNPNYALAGYLSEQLAGKAWADVVTQTVLSPLGLEHTYTRRDDMIALESEIASGFGLTESFDSFGSPLTFYVEEQPSMSWVLPAAQPDNAFIRPAGLVWSTASDQARVLGFLIDGNEQVLNDALRAEMMAVHAPEYNHVDFGYGYGVYRYPGFTGSDDRFYAVPFVTHGGSALTMSSASLVLPEQRVAVSVLSNGWYSGCDSVAAIALELAAAERLPEATEFPEAIAPPSGDLASYAGTFDDPNLGEVQIRWQEEQLLIDVPILAEFGFATTSAILEPYGLDLFVFTIDDTALDLSFYDGVDGAAHQYGVNRDFVLTRR